MAAPIATKLILNTKSFTKGLNAAGKGLRAFGGIAGGALGLITKLGLAFTAFGGVITALVLRQAQFIDRLGKVSDVIGVNIQTLQKFRFAAEQSGVSVEQADVALRRFSRRLGEAQKGTGELAPALRRLGIDVRNTDGTFKSAEEILFEFADGIAATEDQTQRLALAFKAFDSEGAELVKVLAQGSDGLRAFFREAVDLGFILDRETVKGVEEFNDELNKLKIILIGLANRLVAELSPALKQITEDLIEFIKSFKDEEDSFESLGKKLKDDFLDIIVVTAQALETIINLMAAVGNAVVGLARTLGVSGIPELSDDAKAAEERVKALRDIMIGFGQMGNTQAALDDLRDLGVNVDALQKRLDDIGFFGQFTSEFRDLNKDVTALIAQLYETAEQELEEQGKVFEGVDFSAFIEKILGNKEDAKAATEEVTDGITEVLVTAQPRFKKAVAFLDKIFGEDVVNIWLDAMDRMEERGVDMSKTFSETFFKELDKMLSMLEEVGERVKARLGTPLERLTKTLEDGLVKGVEMFEDSLADAIVTGKADFTALGDHIKKVLAKALVQKFITGPIMGLFGLAGGGPARAGQPYIVGEEGPELFIPRNSGTVVPNDETMAMAGGQGFGMSAPTVNYNINAVDAQSFKQLVARDPEFIFNVTQAGARRIPG